MIQSLRPFLLEVAEKAVAQGYTIEQFKLDFALVELRCGFDTAVRTLVLDPDFARAIWGTELVEWRIGDYRVVDPDGAVVMTPAYLLHMQQLAAATDKLDYLQKHVAL